MTKLATVLQQFETALGRLDEVIQEPKGDIIRDSAVKRFEIVFDLCWKMTKTFLEERHGVICRSPKSCFREAYQQKLIAYDDFWIKMADLRNKLVHTYKEETAEEVYGLMPEIFKHFKLLLDDVKK